MASSTLTGNNICAICSSEPTLAITSCEGCMKKYCRRHFNEHREALVADFNRLFDLHNGALEQLQHRFNSLSPPRNDEKARVLFKQIDAWETAALSRVSEVAHQARNEIEHLFDRRPQLQKVQDQINSIKKELIHSQKSDSFIETHITDWNNKLQQLKTQIEQITKKQIDPPILCIQNLYWDKAIEILQPETDQSRATG